MDMTLSWLAALVAFSSCSVSAVLCLLLIQEHFWRLCSGTRREMLTGAVVALLLSPLACFDVGKKPTTLL